MSGAAGPKDVGGPDGGGWQGSAASPSPDPGPSPGPGEEADARRPLVERIGLFLIALVLAALFGGIALALVTGGELFLGIMAAIGCAMTVWVGGLTLLRG